MGERRRQPLALHLGMQRGERLTLGARDLDEAERRAPAVRVRVRVRVS